MNTTYETQYHTSGNISYIGNIINVDNTQLAHGKGAVYYDVCNYKAKYFGEFENGMYDGKGIFYNKDNKIRVEFNTISNGIPINNGKLYFDYVRLGKKQPIDINFNQFWDAMKFVSNEKKSKQKLVASDGFVDMIATYYWKDPISLSEVAFRDKSIDDKQIELFEKMNTVQIAITNKLKYNTDILEQASNIINQSIMYHMFINIVMFMLLVLFLIYTQ
jgi:hypothetical protein